MNLLILKLEKDFPTNQLSVITWISPDFLGTNGGYSIFIDNR